MTSGRGLGDQAMTSTETLADTVFCAIKNYMDKAIARAVATCKDYSRNLNAAAGDLKGELREYVDGQIEMALTSANKHAERLDAAAADDLVTSASNLITERSEKQSETLKSFERRVSRHAEHLERLENRLRTLEGK